MLGSVACGLIERRFIDAPYSSVAAWFVRRAAGGLLFIVNRAGCLTPGAERYAESWFRQQAMARARLCGVLLVSELAEKAPFFAGHLLPPV